MDPPSGPLARARRLDSVCAFRCVDPL